MRVQTAPDRAGSSPTTAVAQDNQLSPVDQAMFCTLRAMDRDAVVQCVWLYEHPINLEGLRRFHHNLGYGLLGRRIERSPIPFARDRWVRDRWPAALDIDECARPRAELGDWIDNRARLRVDPERGPGWHLGIVQLTDGTTVVSLVASHCLIDGLGVVRAIADAAAGNRRELGYPPPCSRPRLRALRHDARQTIQDVPGAARALRAAVRLSRQRRHGAAPDPIAQRHNAGGLEPDEHVAVPAVVIHIDVEDWDARAEALGGTSHHLAAGLAAKLGERLGRRRSADGAVALQVPLSDRTEQDTRANTLSFVSVGIDPSLVTVDLTQTRAAIRKTFETLRENPEQASPTLPLAPLVPFIPRRVLKQAAEAEFAFGDLPVASSSLGELAAMAGCPDGTPAEFAFGRGVIQRVLRGDLERAHGELSLWFLRLGGKMCITVGAYQAGVSNSKPMLRDLVSRTLGEFGLEGVVE